MLLILILNNKFHQYSIKQYSSIHRKHVDMTVRYQEQLEKNHTFHKHLNIIPVDGDIIPAYEWVFIVKLILLKLNSYLLNLR